MIGESAIVRALEPGNYTAIVRSKNNTIEATVNATNSGPFTCK